MNNLNTYLHNKLYYKQVDEKLIINKNSTLKDDKFNFKSKDFDFTIKLPFEFFMPEEDQCIQIDEVKEEKNEFNEQRWGFFFNYEGNKWRFTNLSKLGVYNVFISSNTSTKKYNKCAPLIFYKSGAKSCGKRMEIELNDPFHTILNESQNEPIKYANMILLNPDEDSVLILKRANYMKNFRTMWGFPGGHIDPKDKDSKAAAIRELKEETGIELSFNEEHKCKKFDSIINKDGSICDYWITTLETNVEVKLSREHSKYEWFDEYSKEKHKWMPDVFQIIQKIL